MSHCRWASLPRLFVFAAVLAASSPGGLVAAAQDPFPLPKPTQKVELSDEAIRALADRLCHAVNDGDLEAAKAAIADGARLEKGIGAGEGTAKGWTPLIHAVVAGRADAIDLLLTAGARLEVGDEAGHTPIMYAALTGKIDMARLLLTRGARIDATDSEGSDANAYVKDNAEMTALLAQHKELAKRLLAAIASGDLEAQKKAIADGASANTNDGKTSLLMKAVQLGDVTLGKEALALGARADLWHSDGFSQDTPLAVAAGTSSLELLDALLAAGKPSQPVLDDALAAAADAESDRKERVERLLAAGAKPGQGTLMRTAPLAAAAHRGELELMAILLTAGCDQFSADIALMKAASADDAEVALRTVRALLACGANPKFDYLYATALGAAAEKGHQAVVEELFAKVNDETLNSAVAEAARDGSAAMLKVLLERGGKRVDFKFKPGPYDTALVAAIGKQHLDCVEALLAAGADPNQEPELMSESPLMAAVRTKNVTLVKRLIAAGADPARQWENALSGTQSALKVAESVGDPEILALLRPQVDGDKDPLGATLAASGLHYSDNGAFWRLSFDNSEAHRSQQVYVRKAPDTYESLRVQEIYSTCWESDEAPAEELLRRAFQHRFGIGGLVLEQPSATQKKWRIRFRVAAPCSLSVERLKNYLEIVQATADDLERDFNPGAEDKL